jgi:electron transfer flavoprotein beta subunit
MIIMSILSIIVLIKQVPEIEEVRFNYEKGLLDRSSAHAVINPFDLNALEAAVQIKEKIGGTITACSMGPKKTISSLQDAIARGADKAVLLTDTKFAGADTLATSYTLASAIKKLGRFDLVICGEKTIDGDTAQVGPEVAEFLDIPHISFVDEIIEINKNRLIVKSKIGKNYFLIELKFPGLITITKNANVPRLPKLGDKLRSRKVKIETWNETDLNESSGTNFFGISGSPTWIAKIYSPKNETRRREFIEGTSKEKVRKIVSILKYLCYSE